MSPPSLQVRVGGADAPEVVRDLVGLVVRMRRRRLTRLTLTLSDGIGRGWPLGTPVDVSLARGASFADGDTSTARVFDGAVTVSTHRRPGDGPPVVRLEARDALHRLRTPPHRRVWRSVTERDLVTAVAEDHGLQAEVEAGTTAHGLVRQAGVSDLAFLRQRARRAGCDLWAVGETLHVGPVASRSGQTHLLHWGRELVDVEARTTRASDGGERTRLVAHTTGMPALGVGALVTLTGAGPEVDGHEHRVVGVEHRVDLVSGLRTRVTAWRP
jgi:uncharacterized protein